MKAMILAAGLGTRLGEITAHKPKCLVEIHGKTLLEHAVDRLKDIGVDYVVVNTHYFAEQVEKFVLDRSSFGITVHLSNEAELLDTGGGLYRARHHFEHESEFFVCNADIYHRLDLASALKDHQQKCPLATLIIMSRPTSRYLVFDSEQHLVGRADKRGEPLLVKDAAVQNLYAFSGLQIVTPRLFEYCADFPEKFSSIDLYLKAAATGGTVRGFLAAADPWTDVGTPERLAAMEQSEAF